MNSSQVQITGDSFSIGGGRSQPIASLRQVEVARAENALRSGILFVLGCLAPIAGMVTGRQIMEQPLCTIVTAALFAGPFLAIILAVLWRKPWGVIAEYPTQYRTLYRTGDRAEAEAIVERLRGALRA
jgi:hypothetical protein